MSNIDLTRHRGGDLADIRTILLDVYAEVYAADLTKPFHSVDTFAHRLDAYAAAPGFACVLGWDEGVPVGYAFGYTLQAGARWWIGLTDPVPAAEIEETGRRTFALNELMVRAPWRGTTTARTIHDALVASRGEERVTLLVDPTHPKVLALYERWGYRVLSDLRPAWVDAPVFTVLLLDRE
ncbi:GNAT family N-acetyltransferase [Embleya sp. NBC_00896]|uniref:GNAT family N-acetyltransferase n=1 Tax=Embleya sp. NBC_00896 TaxID=2975961 RepID=UPI0038659D91|nr:N-acetyltransferase [Embleya sp. NBC_00896]